MGSQRTEMLKAVVINKKQPAKVASSFLKSNGLT